MIYLCMYLSLSEAFSLFLLPPLGILEDLETARRRHGQISIQPTVFKMVSKYLKQKACP